MTADTYRYRRRDALSGDGLSEDVTDVFQEDIPTPNCPYGRPLTRRRIELLVISPSRLQTVGAIYEF